MSRSTRTRFLPDAVDNIKSTLTIEDVLTYYQIPIGPNGFAQCPFHADHSPSMRVYTRTNTYKCYACGAWGDQIAFIAGMEQLSNREAIEFIGAEFGIEVHEPDGLSPERKKAIDIARRRRAIARVQSENFEKYRTAVATLTRQRCEALRQFTSTNCDAENDLFWVALKEHERLEYICNCVQGRYVPEGAHSVEYGLDGDELLRNILFHRVNICIDARLGLDI